ncbi:MAG: SDR family NAD(P)-dependent oxidoreductase [Planctomycetota bacterium]
MNQTILITGSTDGIGLEAAKTLMQLGHRVLLHGRSASKLRDAESALSELPGGGEVETYLADLSDLSIVEALAHEVSNRHERLDVLINNAGVYRTPEPLTKDGLDIRFVVNTVAPYLLTKRLLPLFTPSGRVINLSSAAQARVDLQALEGSARLRDDMAYAQSKLAITMWSRQLALSLSDQGPSVIAVNPGSMLGTKMVKEAYGVAGGDVQIGAEILRRAALGDEFSGASGRYFDNDSRQFASPHPDALDPERTHEVVSAIEAILSSRGLLG